VVYILVPSVCIYFEICLTVSDRTYRYCRLFDSVLHTNVITHNDAALHSGAGDDDNPTDPKLIIHVYHMVAAMDGVYEFISEYHEDWRTGLRSWLLRYCVRTPMRQYTIFVLQMFLVRNSRTTGNTVCRCVHCTAQLS
jgi:hypothetical protein